MGLRPRLAVIALLAAAVIALAGCQPPPNTGSFDAPPTPTITGTQQVGNTLTATVGDWTPEPDSLGYQWFANNAAIAGATESTFELTYGEADAAVTVSVTAQRAGIIPTTRTSAATSPVIPTFADVPTDAPFYYEILWMSESGLTSGTVDGGLRTFHPQEPVTRETMAAFLYAAAGSPAFTPPSTATFTDVPAGSAFALPIEWLKAEGIANGNADGTFRPLDPVSRQAMAAFLYRTAGSPEFTPPAVSSFTDLPAGAPFSHEIEWLTAEGVTTGSENGDGTRSFHPIDPVTRQAMAAFLYRTFG